MEKVVNIDMIFSESNDEQHQKEISQYIDDARLIKLGFHKKRNKNRVVLPYVQIKPDKQMINEDL